MRQFEKIQQYFLNPEEIILNEVEQEYLKKIWRAYAFLEQYDHTGVASNMLMKGEEELGKKISRSTAFKLIREAQLLLAPIVEFKRNYLKNLTINTLINDLKKVEKMIDWSMEQEPPKRRIWMEAMKRKNDIIQSLIKLIGDEKDIDNEIDFENLEGHTYVIHVDPVFEKTAIKLLNSTGSLDLSKSLDLVIKDIDYEEINTVNKDEE